MDLEERKKFWDVLLSLKGENIEEESKLLGATITFPQYLYRYRRVNKRSLDALRTNSLFFAKASMYDDPFDTFLHVDIKKILEMYWSNFTSSEDRKQVTENTLKLWKDTPVGQKIEFMLQDKQHFEYAVRRGAEEIVFSILSLRTDLQRKLFSICFSEDSSNETLWLKYAANHTGFVLKYDIAEKKEFICGTHAECSKHTDREDTINLYPLYYSNEAYDATSVASALFFQKVKDYFKLDFLEKETSFQPWDLERVCLIKKECHHYDKEWRLLGSNLGANPRIKWRPSEVILGLRMSNEDAALITFLAKQAGIPKVSQAYIDADNNLAYGLINA